MQNSKEFMQLQRDVAAITQRVDEVVIPMLKELKEKLENNYVTKDQVYWKMIVSVGSAGISVLSALYIFFQNKNA